MSTEHARLTKHALTLAEWKALELTRPFTDHPIGGLTTSRRDMDALSSALFDDGPSPAQPGWKAPAKPAPRQRRRNNKDRAA